MLKYAAIIGCQFKNMFAVEQVPVVCCEPEVIGNSLLTGSRGGSMQFISHLDVAIFATILRVQRCPGDFGRDRQVKC